ncbi:unnamed protein product [Rotaria socialis]|uniref:Uncharacterized protein n=1 Tax=Rotaria socialis TaxID=392032 RepID=A0A818H884_9BILA|nr:unnamed protein product [Rotaria socialis]
MRMHHKHSRTFIFDIILNKSSKCVSFRFVTLLTIILILIHWNVGFYFIISRWIGYSFDYWLYNMTRTTLISQYLYCFFWSAVVLSNIDEMLPPETCVTICC